MIDISCYTEDELNAALGLLMLAERPIIMNRNESTVENNSTPTAATAQAATAIKPTPNGNSGLRKARIKTTTITKTIKKYRPLTLSPQNNAEQQATGNNRRTVSATSTGSTSMDFVFQRNQKPGTTIRTNVITKERIVKIRNTVPTATGAGPLPTQSTSATANANITAMRSGLSTRVVSQGPVISTNVSALRNKQQNAAKPVAATHGTLYLRPQNTANPAAAVSANAAAVSVNTVNTSNIGLPMRGSVILPQTTHVGTHVPDEAGTFETDDVGALNLVLSPAPKKKKHEKENEH